MQLSAHCSKYSLCDHKLHRPLRAQKDNNNGNKGQRPSGQKAYTRRGRERKSVTTEAAVSAAAGRCAFETLSLSGQERPNNLSGRDVRLFQLNFLLESLLIVQFGTDAMHLLRVLGALVRHARILLASAVDNQYSMANCLHVQQISLHCVRAIQQMAQGGY